ncbi:hypothetical protein RHMOL_Rhmol04G0146600 [Rhododendron molle]|uniref:Uncharacterized protein n=1 Tax=Rhododendron molle TaxID=49168 RepID=A0ACC0P2W0_RHOML|nr:hypothetical protein RHMOL_Rhmol04G0146600 [Rhododendron molle]
MHLKKHFKLHLISRDIACTSQLDQGSVLRSVLRGCRRCLSGIGLTIGDIHCVELVEYYKCTKNQLDQLIFGTLVVLDELYLVDLSDCQTDAGKAALAAAQHVVQNGAAQHTPLVPTKHSILNAIQILTINVLPFPGISLCEDYWFEINFFLLHRLIFLFIGSMPLSKQMSINY